ncbi:MAG TPA: DNA-primase RepB domain-containing protein [Rhodanobacteraceae bacterium]|nr:DNA-primase RepB domain-containing protein [Rhodanobacteraceae bacterium]
MGAAEELRSSPDADAFLRLLAGVNASITFQTFDETGAKRPALSKVLHGTLAEHAAALARLNAAGAGVFWMVNAGDGVGRAATNVRSIRALFVDLDGAPLEPVQAAPLPAHCIVETSPNRWHAYWRVSDCASDDFTRLQKALAARFAADPKVCDLPRVMRLPGFDHRKGGPYRSRVISVSEQPAYTVAELVEGFDLHALKGSEPKQLPNTEPRRKRALPAIIPEGERDNALLSRAAGFVRRGHDAQAVNHRVQRINAVECQPPLCARDVDRIVAQAVAYGSTGFVMLPHKLLDSAEWKTLPPPAQSIIITAFRRFDGSNNDNIALTWADFDGRPGFANKGTFYRNRARAVASGILRRAVEGGYTRDGKKPDLFAIAPQWLHGSPVSDLKPCASVENIHPYIDKQVQQQLVRRVPDRAEGEWKS